jgi:phosphoserine phosphatase RsbU/P
MRILVADDSKTSRTRLKQILTAWGYDIQVATDGYEAWRMLSASDRPEIAILDWMMPGIDGIDLCRKIRRKAELRDLYIILLSSRDKRDDIYEGIHAGANDYIFKSHAEEDLKIRLEVGRSIVELKHELISKQKMQGALELAGAICHELNQPLQVILGYSEMLADEMPQDHPDRETIMEMQHASQRIGSLTRRLMNITRYETMDYLGDHKIMDIGLSADDMQSEKEK